MKDIRPPTLFEQKVYDTISKIPKGHVMTYGELAEKVQSSPRAVGQALKRNPYAPKVPCHRVIGKNGTLTGFGGGLPAKEKLLQIEGAL